MDTRRLILFVVFSFSIMMLWDAWQRQFIPVPTQATGQTQNNSNVAVNQTAPTVAGTPVTNTNIAAANNGVFSLAKGQRVAVKTDLFTAEIDTNGGDIRRLWLNQHQADGNKSGSFLLMDDMGSEMTYVAQSGLLGENLPNAQAQYSTQSNTYTLADGAEKQQVRLSWAANGVNVDKIYTFTRGSYQIGVRFEVNNGSANAVTPNAFYQIVHDSESKQGSAMMPTFTGGAYYTAVDEFNKIDFDDMAEKNFAKSSKDGWIGLLQHYFVGAWIPAKEVQRELYTNKLNDKLYAIGVNVPAAPLQAGSKTSIETTLFAGPQTNKDLLAAAPGLEFTADYGRLSFIAKPLFWLLSKIYSLVQNWGVAIILLTVLIKAAFYKLSATSYRSMAQMRELAPRLQAMKEKFGDDKQKMQQAMLEMYRKEKINPMGGCLPILVQIPVFIALYWVLLGSVELRHAPFFGWIKDLSTPDPWYILPILMGASMIIQTSLSPAPPDPIQAKVMKIMPVMMSVFFFFFPAGLVLYWLVNNILSIAQQWYINKNIHAEALAKKGSGNR
jgi:YidC/Oxa1 family membrane protein insertase